MGLPAASLKYFKASSEGTGGEGGGEKKKRERERDVVTKINYSRYYGNNPEEATLDIHSR